MADERKDEAAGRKRRPERYPPANRTDAIEPRSFDPAADAPTPRDSGEGSGHMGPGGDPAEGRR
jgi:hypothetical protein